jgi:anoctamin-10
MSAPRQRVTRSKSQQPIPDDEKAQLAPEVKASSTSAGPPVPSKLDSNHPSNPFNVDFVIPYDISIKGDRTKGVSEVREGYEALLRVLEGEGGLKVASRPAKVSGKDKKEDEKKPEEVWVFVGISDEKAKELVERERYVLPSLS